MSRMGDFEALWSDCGVAYVAKGHLCPLVFAVMVSDYTSDPTDIGIALECRHTHARWTPTIDEDTGRSHKGSGMTLYDGQRPGRGVFAATVWCDWYTERPRRSA